MTSNAAQLGGQFGASANTGPLQPYPYASTSATYNSVNYNGGATYNDQFSSSSLPQSQVQNFIQAPPTTGINQQQQQQRHGLRYGDRTSVSQSGGGRRNQQFGPIATRSDGRPVVPLYSYQTTATNNGSFVQVPLFWTALSIALGYEVRGDEVIRGLPCIRRLYQLFCRNAGSQYPMDRIESFISENKALTRRMFGEYQPAPDIPQEPLMRTRRSNSGRGSYGSGSGGNNTVTPPPSKRYRRQAVSPPPAIDKGSKHLVDSCDSELKIMTPYWAANSAGEIRAIVNTKHFPQAIHQEICKGTTTSHCGGDCICEQKYTYHRLLAYDPDNDCKGIFIDWFLYPSCCSCRCPP